MTRSNLDIRSATLPGGSHLLINTDHRLPICTVMVWFEVGSRTEKNGQSGISHYLEHCYSMGTHRFKPRENSWIIQRLGGTKNAFTSHDYTAYYSQVPLSAMEMVIDMEADRFYNLALPENMVTSEKEVIKEEKRLRYEDAPMGKLYEHVLDLAYENHPYKNLVIGSWDDLDHIGRDDLMAYYRQQYVSNKMTLVISGDGDPDAWQVLAERYFGTPKEGSSLSTEVRLTEPARSLARRRVVNKEVALSAIHIAFSAVHVDHPDFAALSFLSGVLATGKSSRLYRHLVYDPQKATSVSCSMDEKKEDGLFHVTAQARPEIAIEELEQALWDELNKLKTELITLREWERMRNIIRSEWAQSLETTLGRAQWIGRYKTISGRYHNGQLDALENDFMRVSPEDIRRVAQSYLIPEKSNTVILKP